LFCIAQFFSTFRRQRLGSAQRVFIPDKRRERLMPKIDRLQDVKARGLSLIFLDIYRSRKGLKY